MRLIDADAVDMSESGIIGYTSRESACEAAQDYIDSLPTIEAEPVVHAHWETPTKFGHYLSLDIPHCSACGYAPLGGISKDEKFCAGCGAKMDEEVQI